MGRKNQGPKLVEDPRTGNWLVRFRHEGRLYKRSTGTQDRAEASRRVEQIWRKATSPDRREGLREAPELHLLYAQWLVYLSRLEKRKSPDWIAECERYYRSHFHGTFRDLDDMAAEEAWKVYIRSRLRTVKRSTVSKECSAGRTFLEWAQYEGYIKAAPIIKIPKNRQGVANPNQKKSPVELSKAQAEAIIRHLPERTKRGGLPARAFYRFMWETGLRRGTLWRLRAEDLDAQGGYLKIRAEADKARYARNIPISRLAVEALQSVGRECGIIFGRSDMRTTLKAAAKAAHDEARAAGDRAGEIPRHAEVSNHDFRHARQTLLASTPGADPASFMFLAGHKHLATASRYLHPAAKEAERMVRDNESR